MNFVNLDPDRVSFVDCPEWIRTIYFRTTHPSLLEPMLKYTVRGSVPRFRSETGGVSVP